MDTNQMNLDKVKSSVDYRILIKDEECYFKIGTIIVKTYQGDIFYKPSNKYSINKETLERKEIDHIAWHINGQVHIKNKESCEKYQIIQKGEDRQKLSEMGFQEMLSDYIEDYKKLPIYEKKVVPLDVVFNLNKQVTQLCFNFSIVSGRLIAAAYRGQNVPITQKNIKSTDDGIGVVQRALGWHSGNADVMLQYSLKKSTNKNMTTNRRLFIRHDMKISKPSIKL